MFLFDNVAGNNRERTENAYLFHISCVSLKSISFSWINLYNDFMFQVRLHYKTQLPVYDAKLEK